MNKIEWRLTPLQKQGITKMYSIMVNMIQDHDIGDFFIIRGNQYTLGQISTVLKQYLINETYDENDKEYLNEVRNLVLSYQNGTLKSSFDEDSFDEITWAM